MDGVAKVKFLNLYPLTLSKYFEGILIFQKYSIFSEKMHVIERIS